MTSTTTTTALALFAASLALLSASVPAPASAGSNSQGAMCFSNENGECDMFPVGHRSLFISNGTRYCCGRGTAVGFDGGPCHCVDIWTGGDTSGGGPLDNLALCRPWPVDRKSWSFSDGPPTAAGAGLVAVPSENPQWKSCPPPWYRTQCVAFQPCHDRPEGCAIFDVPVGTTVWFGPLTGPWLRHIVDVADIEGCNNGNAFRCAPGFRCDPRHFGLAACGYDPGLFCIFGYDAVADARACPVVANRATRYDNFVEFYVNYYIPPPIDTIYPGSDIMAAAAGVSPDGFIEGLADGQACCAKCLAWSSAQGGDRPCVAFEFAPANGSWLPRSRCFLKYALEGPAQPGPFSFTVRLSTSLRPWTPPAPVPAGTEPPWPQLPLLTPEERDCTASGGLYCLVAVEGYILANSRCLTMGATPGLRTGTDTLGLCDGIADCIRCDPVNGGCFTTNEDESDARCLAAYTAAGIPPARIPPPGEWRTDLRQAGFRNYGISGYTEQPVPPTPTPTPPTPPAPPTPTPATATPPTLAPTPALSAGPNNGAAEEPVEVSAAPMRSSSFCAVASWACVLAVVMIAAGLF